MSQEKNGKHINKSTHRLDGDSISKKDIAENIINSCTDGIVTFDKHYRYTIWNPVAEKASGRKKDEVIGRVAFEVFPLLKKTDDHMLFSSVIKGSTFSFKDRPFKLHKKDEPIFYDSSWVPLKSSSNEITGGLVIFRECTERKQTEELLKKSEYRLKKSQEMAHLGSWDFDIANNKLKWSDEAYRILGLKPNEIEATYEAYLQTVHPDDRKMVNEAYSRSIKENKDTLEIDHRIVKKNAKEVRFVCIKCQHFKDKSGKVIRSIGMIHDITPIMQAHEKATKAYENEHHISLTLQKSLLPLEIPKIEGLEVKYFYQSASDGVEVGGDFYNIFEIPGKGFGIVVGDVSGKGIDVAAETAKVKYLLLDRAYAGLSPKDVLASVNNTLVKQNTERFTALSYGIYNPRTAHFEFTDAGNPYPYLVREDRFLEISGVPVSIMSKEKYPHADVELKKNDVIIMHTDGLTEARYKNELFGEERVRNYAQKNKSLTLSKLVHGLVSEARRFSHNNLTDDILVIGLKKT